MNTIKLIEFRRCHRLEKLASASSVINHAGSLFVIGDSSCHLWQIDRQGEIFSYPLSEDAFLEDEPLAKKVKPDFEGMVFDADRRQLYLLPSGSRKNRYKGVCVGIDNIPGDLTPVDVKSLYKRVKKQADIKSKDLNIEGGGKIRDGRWFLINRGNGPSQKNLVIELEGDCLMNAEPINSREVALPALGGVRATITDGFVVDEMLYLVAAAEGVESTWLDGEVTGSLFACYDMQKNELKAWNRLPGSIKFEGVALEQLTQERVAVYFCSDQDDPGKPGEIYYAVFELN